MFANKNILITGAAGTIGSKLLKHLLTFDPIKIICLDIAETPLFYLDHEFKQEKSSERIVEFVLGTITDSKLIERILKRNKIDFIFHTAAYKHVPIIENNPISGVEVNVFGTKIISDLASEYSVGNFIFISTDKAVNPSSVMGATKTIGENYLRALSNNQNNKTKFITVRFGNVINSNGSVLPLFEDQIKKGGPLTVTHKEATRYFLKIERILPLIESSIRIARSGDIFSFEMGKAKNIYDIALQTIDKAGLKLNDIGIKIIGLRSGEKIHEDLTCKNSKLIQTNVPDLYLVNFKENYSKEYIDREIDKLKELLKKQDNSEIVKQLKNIVKNYKSRNSEYELLD